VPHSREFVDLAALNRYLRAWCERERLRCGEELPASHARTYVRAAVVLELAHYLEAFPRKPRAPLSCAALESADPVSLQARDPAARHPDAQRRFAEVLLLGRELGLARLAEALSARLAGGGSLEAPYYVRQLALNAAYEPPSPVAVLEKVALRLPAADPACSDALCGCPT